MTDIQAFKKKAEILADCGTPVTPLEYYRDIFPPATIERPDHPEDHQPNPIIMYTVQTNEGKVFHRNELMFSDYAAVEKVQRNIFAVCSMVTYSGRKRIAKKNAYRIHGFCVDLDGVGIKQLEYFLGGCEAGYYPIPTYICNSGHGLHLVYVFQNYIPLYPVIREPLQRLKRGLTYTVWNDSSSLRSREFQGIYQGFRMPGTCTKLGKGKDASKYLVGVYRFGQKWSIDQLNRYVDEEFRMNTAADLGSYEWADEEHLTLDKAKEIYPDWYHKRIELNLPRGHYKTNEGLYHWWVQTLRQRKNISVGHRYHCVKCLFIYALKSGVSLETAYDDALSLLDEFNQIDGAAGNPFTVEDIKAASKMYSEPYHDFSREAVELCSGIPIQSCRRNGRSQDIHLKRARAVQEIDDPDGLWRNKDGAPTKQAIVAQWRAEHPGGKKIDCERETGLSRHTILKWWDS